jgi:hypothetical protein
MNITTARRQVITEFCAAQPIPSKYEDETKTLALWQLLMEEKIVPLNSSLWMATREAKQELN